MLYGSMCDGRGTREETFQSPEGPKRAVLATACGVVVPKRLRAKTSHVNVTQAIISRGEAFLTFSITFPPFFSPYPFQK